MDWGKLARALRAAKHIARGGALVKCHGHWKAELIGPDGRVKATREVDNLIVNAGLDHLKSFYLDSVTPSAQTRMGWIAIGSGATAPAATDVALQTELAREAVEAYTPGGVGVATIENTFAAGVGTGTVAEAGVFDAAAAGDMFNRVTFGAIVKGAGDTLKVTVTVTWTSV